MIADQMGLFIDTVGDDRVLVKQDRTYGPYVRLFASGGEAVLSRQDVQALWYALDYVLTQAETPRT